MTREKVGGEWVGQKLASDTVKVDTGGQGLPGRCVRWET